MCVKNQNTHQEDTILISLLRHKWSNFTLSWLSQNTVYGLYEIVLFLYINIGYIFCCIFYKHVEYTNYIMANI